MSLSVQQVDKGECVGALVDVETNITLDLQLFPYSPLL